MDRLESSGKGQIENRKNSTSLILLCKVRDLTIGLPFEGLSGVERVSSGRNLPGTPAFITGLHYVSKGILVGIDLGVILGKSAIRLTSSSRSIIAESEGVRAILLVDEIITMPSIRIMTNDSNSNVTDLLGADVCQWKGEEVRIISPKNIINFAKEHSLDSSTGMEI